MGWKTDQIISAMPGMLNLASAGALDLGRAADIVSDTMQAMGMKATESGHAADVFAYAQANANTNVEQLGEAMKYAAPMAHTYGWSIEQTSAGMMALANSGIKGSLAGQAFASSLGRLANPTKRMKKVLAATNMEFFDANEKMKPLPEVIAELEKATGKMTDKQRAATLSTLFGAEAFKHWAVLLDTGSASLRNMTTELENADGTAAKMAETMLDNLNGQVTLLKSSLEGAAISIGSALIPAIRTMTKFINKIVDGFNSLSDSTKSFLAIGTAVSAIFAIFGGLALILLGAIPGLVSGFGAIAAMFSITSLALLKIVAIAGGVISLIILLGAAFYIAYQEVEGFRNGVNSALAWIVNAAKVTGAAIKSAFGNSIAWTVQKFNELKVAGANTFASIGEWISGAFQKVSSVVEPILGGIIGKLQTFGGEAKDAVKKAMNLDFSGIAEIAAKFIPSLIGLLLGGIPRLIIVGVNMISMIANGMGITVPELMDKVVGAVTGMIDTFVANLPKFLEAGVQLITGLLNGILSQIPSLIGVITQLVNTFTSSLTTILPKLTTAGTQILTTLVLGIAVALPQLITAAIGIFTTLLGAIIAALPTIIDAGINVLSALISGIVQALPLIIEAGISLLSALIQGIISILPVLIETAFMLIMSVAQLLIQNLPVILDAGIQILMALIDGIVKIVPILIKTAIDLVFAIVKALIANLPAILNAGVQLVMALISGLVKILPMLITTAIKLAVSIIKAIIQHLPQILSAGAQLILALIQGLVSIIGQLGSAAMKIGGKIIEVVSKVDLLQVGKDIIRGLISGIGSMASAVWNKAKEIANGVGNAIKSALQIKSPSREMMKLGVYTGEGFANGIASMINSVKAITGDMALAALPETSTLSLAYDTPSSAGMAAGVQASYDVNTKNSGLESLLMKLDRKLDGLGKLTVEMDGYEVGRVVEPHVDSLQASKFSRTAYMNGMK